MNILPDFKNFNMEVMRRPGNGWPASRQTLWGQSWLHSDIRDVALPYVYPVFAQMLDLGGFTK